MRWFKHLTHSSRDEKLSRLRDEFGLQGYGAYWVILETIAEQMGDSDRTWIEFSIKNWQNLTEFSPKKLKNFLELCQNLQIFMVDFSQKYIKVNCPKLLKYRDEYTRKKTKVSGQNPEIVALETETDTETEKENTPPTPSRGVSVREVSKNQEAASQARDYLERSATGGTGNPSVGNTAWVERYFSRALDDNPELNPVVALSCWYDTVDQATASGKFSPNWLKTVFEGRLAKPRDTKTKLHASLPQAKGRIDRVVEALATGSPVRHRWSGKVYTKDNPLERVNDSPQWGGNPQCDRLRDPTDGESFPLQDFEVVKEGENQQ